MLRLPRLDSRAERIAREHDEAARIAAEAEAKRAKIERERLARMEVRCRLAGTLSS